MAMAASHNAILSLLIASSLLALSVAHDDFVKFGYKGSIGPDNWGSLSPDYELCSKGTRQSPINIVKDNAVLNAKLDPLHRNFTDANATLIGNGFSVSLHFDDGVGKMLVDGKNYSLKHMDWHSPSEHTIDGERFPVELHMAHESDDGKISVVAILYQYGNPDPFLAQIRPKLGELAEESCAADEEAHIAVGVVNTRALKRATRKYFRYVGSLTTPPCTENVTWNILGKVREMSKQQADALSMLLAGEFQNNSRPTQPLNGRSVELYDGTPLKQH